MPNFLQIRPLGASLQRSYAFHTGWNTSKIISRLINLRFLLGLTLTWAMWFKRNIPKIRVEKGRCHEQKTCNIAEAVKDRTKVTIAD